MRNLFIVFEGIDGSGTSTQAELLKKYFLSQGKSALTSPEPSNSPIGKLIREILKNQIITIKDSHKFDEQMAYLFAADRYCHLYNDLDGVIKLLQENIVISTRYYFSSLAYHCHSPEDFEWVGSLNKKFPNPDLVIYINVPIEVSLKRLDNREYREIYEEKDKLIIVKNNYETIFSTYQGLQLKVDGNQQPKIIHQEIVSFIEEKFFKEQ